MKKVFLLMILSLFLLIPQIFALEITNQEGTSQDYFSLNEPDVFVETSQTLTNYSVEYSLLGVNYSEVYSLSACSSKFCDDFSLVDLFSSQNGSLTGSEQFTIIAGTEQKTISLDIEKPVVTITNSNVNTSSKKIELDFSITDNSNSIRSLKLYSREGSTDTFVKNLTDLTTYDYDFVEEGNTTLVLIGIDEAGNSEEASESFIIGDFFAPTTKDITFIYQNDAYSLKFTAEDKDLDKYEVTQGSLSIVESISGTSVTKTVEIPFDSGSITLKVHDDEGNVKSQSLSIPGKISLNDEKKVSNKKEYSFESSSSECTWTKFNSQNKNEKFDKDGNDFSIDLDVSTNKKYNLKFNCEKSNLIQYFEKEFIYDTVAPSDSELTIEKEDNGELRLEWEESQDSQSDVEYRLLRNGKEVYEGDKLKYFDDNVEYPEEYEYVLEIFDEAGNEIESNEVKAVPLKVIVNVDSNLAITQEIVGESFDLNLNTDENSKVEITVTNDGKIIFQQYYDSVDSVKETLDLNEGNNAVLVQIEDEFGNEFRQTYIVTSLADDALSSGSNEVVETTPTIEAEPVEAEPELIPEESNFWIWFVVVVILIALFIIFVRNIKTTSKSRRRRSNNYDRKRSKDAILSQSLDKIKQRRDERAKVKSNFFAKKKKKPRELSEFDKQKLSDLGVKKKEKIIPTEHKKVEIGKRDKEEHELPPKTQSRHQPPKKKTLKERLFAKKQELPKDPFSAYLMKKRSEKSWDSTKKYRESYHKEIEAKKEAKRREKEEEERLKLKKLDDEAQKRIAEVKPKHKPEEPEKFNRSSLDDYLGKRKKKRGSYFVERFVNRDLRNRSKK